MNKEELLKELTEASYGWSTEHVDLVPLKEVKRIINDYLGNDSWIPVGKKLPRHFQKVIVTYVDHLNNRYTDTAEINRFNEWEFAYGIDISRRVIAWKCLPEPWWDKGVD